MKTKQDMTVTINIRVLVGFVDALKMRLMGRYPASIIARAIAERIKTR